MSEEGATAAPEDVLDGLRYDASSIVILSGLQAVRKNPSMYVGSTGPEGLAQLVDELIDNAVDEVGAGNCRNIVVTLHADGSCSVEDDGRGIPVDIHPEAGRPACEVLLTTLHSGGKFDRSSYPATAGLHGVGLSCVNALAAWLRLDVWRDGSHYRQSFARGVRTTELERLGAATRRGTRVWFQPDATVLDTTFRADAIARRMEEIAFLHPRLRLRLVDAVTGQEQVLAHRSGVRGLLRHRHLGASWIHPEPIVLSEASGPRTLDVAFGWTEGYTEEISSFVNGVATGHGGSHADGLRNALSSAVNRYAKACGLLDTRNGERIAATDVLEGLAAVVSVWMDDPQFDGQTKKRLQNPDVARFVAAAVESELFRRLNEDETLGRRVVERMLDAARARLAARLAGRTARFQQRAVQVDYRIYQRQFGIRSKNWHDSCSWLTDEGLLAEHARHADVPPDARMLDVCCGSGVVGNAFKGRVGEMIGLDITPEMVKLASARLDEVHQGTVYDLPFADASFDLVVNREVLHLLPQPEKPVSEVMRVLRPGGQFIVGQIVPYSDVDAFWMYRIFKKKQPLLFQMFLEEDFRRLLLGAGFTDLKATEYLLWESIDRWIDTHETTPLHRQEIYRLYYDAPAEVRAVHPFEVGAEGTVRDCWRWCVYSVRKPVR